MEGEDKKDAVRIVAISSKYGIDHRPKPHSGKCVKKFRECSVKKEKLFESDKGGRVLFF